MTEELDDPSTITGSLSLITLAAMLASLMAFIDIAIISVALADIRASFGTPIDQISWASTSYMTANIVIIPMSGWFQRRLGYRVYFAGSIALFTLASVLCGLAWNFEALVAFRALQGVGGGAIIPTAQAILFLRYPVARHGMAAALIGLASISGPMIAPYIGGSLIEAGDWHWIFLVNVPVGAIAAALAWSSIREPLFASQRGAPDYVAFTLLVVGLVSLQYVLEEGARDDWFESPNIAMLSVLSVVSIVLFVRGQLNSGRPIVNLRLFRSASYSAATALNFLLGVCVFSAAFMYALFCGSVMRYSALETGTLLMQGNLALMVLMPAMGRLSGAIDGRVLISFGIAALILGLSMNMRLATTADHWTLLQPLLIRAIGIAFVFVPLLPFAVSDLPRAEAGNATALFNLTRELEHRSY